MVEGRLSSMAHLNDIVQDAEEVVRKTEGVRSFDAGKEAVKAKESLQMAGEIQRLWAIETRLKENIHYLEKNMEETLKQKQDAMDEGNKPSLVKDLSFIYGGLLLERNKLKKVLDV